MAVAGGLSAAVKTPLGQAGGPWRDAAHPDPPFGASDPCPSHGRLAL